MNVWASWIFTSSSLRRLAKNLAPYRIGKRPHKQNREKIHQKYRKSYFFSIFDVFQGCYVFLSCRGPSLSQEKTTISDLLELPKERLARPRGPWAGLQPTRLLLSEGLYWGRKRNNTVQPRGFVGVDMPALSGTGDSRESIRANHSQFKPLFL